MGTIRAIIHCDTSFNNGICQTGYFIDMCGETFYGHSSVFRAPDNNSAEIMGIQKACTEAVLFYMNTHINVTDPYFFTVYNDNITAVTVANTSYKPSKKVAGKYESTKEIHAWCKDLNVFLQCNRKKRSHPIMKKCDRLSKLYRKDKKWKHLR